MPAFKTIQFSQLNVIFKVLFVDLERKERKKFEGPKCYFQFNWKWLNLQAAIINCAVCFQSDLISKNSF